MSSNVRRLTAFFVLTFVVAAFGAFAAPPTPQSKTLYTPAQAVRAFYMALVEQRYDEVRALMAAPLIAQVSKTGGFESLLKSRVGDAKLRGIQTVKEQVAGDAATVTYRFYFTDEKTKDGQEALVKEEGVWKITVSAPAGRR